MNRFLCGLLAVCLGSASAPPSYGAAHIQFIDMGTPKNGPVLMNGWRGVVLRASLDGGLPITKINLGGDGIYGYIAQRWTDPTGHADYTQTSPGPISANNTS